MASILRTSKYVRYFAGFARHVVINPPREFDNNLINSAQVFHQSLPRPLVTQASIQRDQNLEKSLKKIDYDVRRSGRISRRELQEVVEELQLSQSLTSSQSLLVIRCCGNLVPEELPEVRTKLVKEIWSSLIKLKVPMDIMHYNALLRVYLENEHQFSPTEFLSELEEKGIEPNRVTYQRLISRYCQLGDIEGATRILEFMREKQLPVNESVFNALIMGHSQAGDMESALDILAVMKKANIDPSADTYTTLLCGYAKKGDIETIHKVIGEIDSQDIYLVDKDYLDVVYALAINGNQIYIPEILTKVNKAYGYNQDAINVIYRLINAGQDDSAFTVLKSMNKNAKTDGTTAPSGGFFVRHLIKANRPIDKVIEICHKLETEHLNENALLLATENSIELANEALAYPLMKELQKRGQEIRQHFFWPLLVANSKDPTGDGIIQVLSQMHNFNVTPTTETIRDYVIPNIKGKSSEIISRLREGNISVGSSACNLVASLLTKNEIEEAAIITSRISAYYTPDMIKRPLTNALYKTNDYKSYISILHHVYDNLDRRDSVLQNSEEPPKEQNKNEIIGEIVYDLTRNRREFFDTIEHVLQGLVDEGLSITANTAEKLQNFLAEKLTPELSNLLERLSSGELTPVPIVRKAPVYTPSEQMNVSQLERLVSNLDAQGQDTLGLKRQLLTMYCRSKELEKTEAFIEELKQTNFAFTVGVYVNLMDLYTYHEKLDKTLEMYDLIIKMDENVVLDDLKLIALAHLLIKNDQFSKGIEFLNKQTKSPKTDLQSFPYTSQCWRLLNVLAEQGKEEELNTLFNTLIDHEYIQANNVMLGPLVKVQLVKENLTKALEVFEWCCTKYRATPFKNELTCKLIQIEDADKLQKLTDLSTTVHGEINSLYDLVFAFVECGRVRQARKILETPGLQTRPRRISNACERYQQEGMLKPLEGLKDATKDLNHIDRSDIYYQLLLSYIKQKDTDKAIGLWTQMQEEDVPPTDFFLRKLGKFLIESDVPVPFNVPQTQVAEPEKVRILKRPAPPLTLATLDPKTFKQAIKAGELDRALEIYKNLKSKLTLTDTSNLVEQLIQQNRLADATKLNLELLNKSVVILPRVFRFLLNKLATNGNVEDIETIGTKIGVETKKLLSYDNRICHANLVAGRVEEYLTKLEKEIDEAQDADLNAVSEKFPRGGVLGILEKCPEHLDKYENMAYKYAHRGIVAPVNALWSYYFSEGQEDKAAHLWKTYLQDTTRVMFQRVLQKARDTSNEVLVEKLIEQLKLSVVTPGAFGNAYSCMLDILVAKEDPEKIVTAFEEVAKNVQLEFLNRTAIVRVKAAYDKLNRPFNYKIPAKTTQAKGNSEDEPQAQAVI